MGLFNMKETRQKNRATKAKLDAVRGKELGHVMMGYVGGFDQAYKDNTGNYSIEGVLYCFENCVYYKKKNNSFYIPANHITSFEVGGRQQTNSRLSVTRMATLGVFSLAAPKRTTVKNTTIVIGIDDGRVVYFHTKQSTEFDVHRKLANAISRYSQRRQLLDTPQAESVDPVKDIEKYADLHKRGILTDEEFRAKKKQLLNL